MMKKVLTVTLAMVMVFAVTSFAQPGGMMGGKWNCDGVGMRGHHGNWGQGMGMRDGRGMGQEFAGVYRMLWMADELELTDQQRDQLEQMHVNFSKQRIDLDANLKKAQVDLRALMVGDNPLQSEVNAAIDKVSQLRAEKQKMHFAHFTEAKSVLTAEQIDKLKEVRGPRWDGEGFRGDDDSRRRPMRNRR